MLYPVRFVGKRRIVTLEGEAYFDVRKDEEHPFVVRTRFGEVTVLGTAFNINAYNDADACYTTLVYGKVNFSTPDQNTITLAPGEQAVVSSRGIEKRAVDILITVDKFNISAGHKVYMFSTTNGWAIS